MIIVNSIIEFMRHDGKNTIERILWISPYQTQLVLINITDNKKIELPYFYIFNDLKTLLEEGHAKIIKHEPDLRLLAPDEAYLGKYQLSRDIKWGIIQELVEFEPDIYDSKLRGKMISDVIERTGKTKKMIYKYLKAYWFYGKTINSLLPLYIDCGVPAKMRNITYKSGPKAEDGNVYIVRNEDKEKFEKAIQKYHIEEEKNLRETYRAMLGDEYNEGYYRLHGELIPIIEDKNCPTERQFRYWYDNEFNKKAKYSAKYGKRKAEMERRAFTGTPEEYLQGPGELFEIDSTPGDVIMLSIDHLTEIGRAHVYFVKDVMSRFIAGVHVCKNPSWEEEMVALENATTDKVQYCEKFGITITQEDWPSRHLPKFLVGDRAETKSKYSNSLVNLNVRVGNPPSYRGDLKPYVEQQHRHFNSRIRDLVKGAVKKEHRVRGDKDPAKDAVLTIEDLTKLVILYVLEYNKGPITDYYVLSKEMFEDKVQLTPLSIWNWGMKKNMLHEMPADLIRFNLLPKAEGLVTRAGIAFEKMSYLCDRGKEEGWFENEQIDGKKRVEFRYDPRNCSSIFIMGKNGKLTQCYLHPRFHEYEGLHLEDVRTIIKYKNQELKREKKDHSQTKYELDAVAKALNITASKKTAIAQKGKSRVAKHKNKRLARKMEKRMQSSRDAWTAVYKRAIPEERQQVIAIPQNPIRNHPLNSNLTASPSTKMNAMQAFLMSKNAERRFNREQ